MESFIIRKAAENDVDRIVEIYNSNTEFLKTHLGKNEVNASFIKQELVEMNRLDFASCVIEMKEKIVGIMDYQDRDCVYLSLLMLDARERGQGLGRACYRQFESMMKARNRKCIHIDVVCENSGNLLPFWESVGFIQNGKSKLFWGEKESEAVVMKKIIG